MPPFDLELTDPTPAAVEKAMADAVVTANGKARIGLMKPDPADYRRFLADEFATQAEGVMMWLADKGRVASYPPTPRATLLGVVWRVTPLGRSVRVAGRRIEPFHENPTHRFGPPYRPWPVLCHLDPDHVVTRAFAGGEPEMIAVCACGAVGPPHTLAWELGQCGPCHDYQVDHGTPPPGGGPPALRTKGQLRGVGFLPSGDKVAAFEWLSLGREGAIHVAVWDRLSGECRSEPPSGKKGSRRIPAKQLATGLILPGPRCLLVSDKGSASQLGAVHYHSALAITGTTAAALQYDGAVARCDLSCEDEWTVVWEGRIGEAEDDLFRAMAFSADGKKVALGRRNGAVDVLDWPAGTGPTLRPDAPATDRYERVHALAFSPDGKHLAAGYGQSGFVEDPGEDWFGWGGGLHLFDLKKGEAAATFARPTDDVLTVAFSPDGSLLFSGATDCNIRVIDVQTRQEIAVLSGHVGCVNALAFSPDGETLASAGGDGLVRLWPWKQLLSRPEAKKKRKGGK